jgi:hypothetical protein
MTECPAEIWVLLVALPIHVWLEIEIRRYLGKQARKRKPPD